MLIGQKILLNYLIFQRPNICRFIILIKVVEDALFFEMISFLIAICTKYISFSRSNKKSKECGYILYSFFLAVIAFISNGGSNKGGIPAEEVIDETKLLT